MQVQCLLDGLAAAAAEREPPLECLRREQDAIRRRRAAELAREPPLQRAPLTQLLRPSGEEAHRSPYAPARQPHPLLLLLLLPPRAERGVRACRSRATHTFHGRRGDGIHDTSRA